MFNWTRSLQSLMMLPQKCHQTREGFRNYIIFHNHYGFLPFPVEKGGKYEKEHSQQMGWLAVALLTELSLAPQ